MGAVRVAVVGAGGVAKQHGRALNSNPSAEVVAVVDVSRDNRESFVEMFGGSPYDCLTDCLSEVDAVYVLTPPGFHAEYAMEALHAGKHLFCEKPLAITIADGRAIVNAAEKCGVVTMTGFNHRYRVGYSRLRQATESGRLGKPYHYWSQRFGMGAGATGKIDRHNWRTDPSTLCGMTVESLSHDIDLLRWIMADEIVSVAAITFNTAPELVGFDNNAHVLMRLQSGASAMITASWSSRIGFNSRGVLGETGSAFVSGTDIGNNGIWCSRQFHLKTDDDEYETVEMLQDDLDDASYQLETDDFINAINNGGSTRVGIRDGYETLRVSTAILRAAQEQSYAAVE